MSLIYKTTKPYLDVSQTYKKDIKNIADIFLETFDFLSKNEYIIRGEKKEYINLITDIYNCVYEIAKFIIIKLCKGEVSQKIIPSLYITIVFLSIKLIGQYDNYEGFQYKLDDILKYIDVKISKKKIKEIEYDILQRTNWLGCKGVNKLHDKSKIKVSTLKHCIQKILKIDTTDMSVESMKEIILNTLEEKKEEKKEETSTGGKVYICTMKRGLARPKPDTDEKFLSLNVTSAQSTENEDRRDFSPMTEIPGGYRGFWNFEHFWQSGKVHTGFDDNYIKSVWKSLKEPTRYFPISEIKKYCKKNKIAIPKKDSEIREFFMKKLTHSSWDDGEKMDWVTSRKKVYAPLYFEYMKDKPSVLKWKKLRKDGKNIVVYDFDGPKDKDGNGICLEVTLETLKKQINNTRFSFGHGYIVAGWLLGIRPEEYIL
jgi:hypothetical protein